MLWCGSEQRSSAGLKSTSRARVERNRAAWKCGEIYGAEHEAHDRAPISSASGEPRGMPGCLVINNRDRDGYFDYARLSSSSNFSSIWRDFFTALARIMTMLLLRTWGIRLAVPPPAGCMVIQLF